MKIVSTLALALLLAGCSGSQQLDRDFALCTVLVKAGGACTVSVPASASQVKP